jgi:F-type H+-transporting ATPase subunit b
MNAMYLLAAADSGGQIQQIASTFGVDWPHLVSQIISFCIVCFLLQRFAYKPVLKMLEERRQLIALGKANAEQIAAELARTEAQRQEVLMKANAEATELIAEARAAAARVLQGETQKATAAAEQIMVKSREAATQDYARMLAELKSQMGQLVVQTAATVTGKILTAEDQRRLTEETVGQIAA